MDAPAWQMSRDTFQVRAGVHRPWACEISPFQYQRMSKRAQAQYDAKREREWNASAECADAYRRAVVAAFDAGEVRPEDPLLHPDAKSAYWAEVVAREKAAAEERFILASRENRISSVSDLRPGDRVFSVMGSRYGVVVKLHKRGARVRFEPPAWRVELERKLAAGELLNDAERSSLAHAPSDEYAADVHALQWRRYDDLKLLAERGDRVRPARFYESAPVHEALEAIA